MIGLLLAVTIPLWPEIRSSTADTWIESASLAFSKIRKASEPEVIAEFLRAEFYQPEFDLYRSRFAEVVANPDLSNQRDNEIRRTLLFRRRGRMWRELPHDTEWWEIELHSCDLPRVRAFPRKQWRKFAKGDFYLANMIPRIRSAVESEDRSSFSEKMRSVAADLQQNRVPNSVLLIGVNESSPLTIIEGNHRMAAAMLVSPEAVNQQFRFFCGLSPRMTSCCWYRTDLRSLTRYATNIVRYLLHDRDYFVQKTLREKLGTLGA
jgi:hypothetical protein